jgi:RNA polymerase sigma-70 factor (ECF subfamily)
MSRETRFDKLESDIVDALRRAPGAAPSADLDARILARAHAAVAKPAKRPQPIWFSMAAGLVEALPMEQRAVLLMRAEGDLTLEEIAVTVGTGRETIKSRLRYALAKLREGLRAP